MFFTLICLLTGLYSLSIAEESTEQLLPELQLSPAEILVNKGSGVKITPTVSNAPAGVSVKKYEWSSSDPGVAEYNGTIRGTGAGQATITCTAVLSDGTTLSADCAVSVKIPVTGIQADSKALTVMAGDLLTPAMTVFPEDATNPAILFSSSDEQILSVGPDGQITALAEGKANLTAVSEDNPAKKINILVTVTRRIGKTDQEITFLGIPWESDCETCIRLLKEAGVIGEEVRSRFSYTGTAWHWPENDLLFTRISAWRSLPAVFTDRQIGAARTSIQLKKTIGGYLPQTATLVFFNTIGQNGQIDPDVTGLTGVYFSFESRDVQGADIFCGLLERLENAYGEFTRYQSKDIPRFYKELNEKIKGVMAGATEYSVQELGEGVYLGEYALCTIHGINNTGIMLSIDTNESVTLFYGRTDAPDLIRALQESPAMEPVRMDDAGV